MNFIDCNDAYSLFPHTTFHERVAFVTAHGLVSSNSRRTKMEIDFSIQHGWTIDGGDALGYTSRRPVAPHVHPEERLRTERWVGDMCNWKFPIARQRLEPPESAQWQLRWYYFRFTESQIHFPSRVHQCLELPLGNLPFWSRDQHMEREVQLEGRRVTTPYHQVLFSECVELPILVDAGGRFDYHRPTARCNL